MPSWSVWWWRSSCWAWPASDAGSVTPLLIWLRCFQDCRASRPAITRAWLILVFPACVLSYMGQGALVLDDPEGSISSPFFLLVPEWGRLPMVLLATAATVIASQAVITGAFSVAQQAVQLGYLPRLRIIHTSEKVAGQIYVPWVNWALMVGVLILVFAFRSSAALAFAFGMAVTCTITITTILFFAIVRFQWRQPLWLVLLGGGVFLLLEGLFLRPTSPSWSTARGCRCSSASWSSP
jgi:KUP system potassium uptake protein